MKDYNSAESVKDRVSQEDPIVMYLIVRESLGMSTGKTAAQCAHAAQALTLKYMKLDKVALTTNDYKQKIMWLEFQEWMDSSFRKVVLKADDKEWQKLKGEFKDNMVLIVDAGLTEIPSGSETVIGLWPMKKSLVPKIVKRLQVLK